MEKEVRPIDANAMARKIREYMEDFPNAKTRLATCRVVLSMLGDEGQTPTLTDHFPGDKKMIPLTLEQLREMDGQPVWCEWLLPKDRAVEDGKWFIVIVGEKTGLEIKRPAEYGDYFLKTEEYGQTWLAYAYPPAHIDREAWTAEWIKYDGYTECSKCKHWYDSPESEDDGDRPAFCPSCGRAMTPEAWAELEKRMGVRV